MKYAESGVNQLTQTIFAEVEQAKQGGPFIVSPNVDLVWAVSSTGTVKQPAELGEENPYTGVLFDRGIVDESVRIVRGVTALRVDKTMDDVTLRDIETYGPAMLYNGERPGLPNGKWPKQNEHFEELVSGPGFPIPRSNIIIGKIEEANTRAQVRQLAELLHDNPEMKRLVATCGIGHSIRVGRYVEHDRHLMPIETTILPAFVSQGEDREDRIAQLETGKAIQYWQMGHLAAKSAFFA